MWKIIRTKQIKVNCRNLFIHTSCVQTSHWSYNNIVIDLYNNSKLHQTMSRINPIFKHTNVILQLSTCIFLNSPSCFMGTNLLAKTQLVGINRCCDLWESAEGESALHFANVIVQNRLWTERLRQLETVCHLQRLTNGLENQIKSPCQSTLIISIHWYNFIWEYYVIDIEYYGMNRNYPLPCTCAHDTRWNTIGLSNFNVGRSHRTGYSFLP